MGDITTGSHEYCDGCRKGNIGEGAWRWSLEALPENDGEGSVLFKKHLTRLVREIGTEGKCLTRYEAESLCGEKFNTTVDSSD